MNDIILVIFLVGLSLIFLNLDTNVIFGQIDIKNNMSNNNILMNISNMSIFSTTDINKVDNLHDQDKQDIKVVELLGNNFSFPLSYEVIDGIPLAEGDIIVDTTIRDPFEAAGDRFIYSNKWPGGKIPYKIDASLDQDKIEMIKRAIDYWNTNTPIEFIDITSSNQLHKDYVFIKKHTGLDLILRGDTACASAVGKLAKGGEQKIVILPKCEYGNMIHELGHTVGFWHEHQRPDRDKHVEIVWDNIKPGDSYKFQFAIELCFKFQGEEVCDFPDETGDYDYCSIQHYKRNAFAKHPGLETIRPLNVTGCEIGQREFLSQGDIAAVNKLYSSELISTLTDIPEVQFLQYEDDFFKIEYPKDSTINGPFSAGGEYSVYFTPTGIEFIDPLGVNVIDIPSQITLEDYVATEKLSNKDIIGDHLINTTETRITINNISAIELRHHNLWEETPSIWTTTYLLDDSKIYAISYDIFKRDLDAKSKTVIDHMVNSFKINN